jgi:hypothetical protein
MHTGARDKSSHITPFLAAQCAEFRFARIVSSPLPANAERKELDTIDLGNL